MQICVEDMCACCYVPQDLDAMADSAKDLCEAASALLRNDICHRYDATKREQSVIESLVDESKALLGKLSL